ncbi:MAG: hypothetical protein P4M05_07810 [Bradyrhizobium sp.]|nr:hypothetical protein [Bradyrhizobium sp.]
MSQVTVLLARGIGIFTVVLVTAIMVRGVSVIAATVADGPVMLAYAIISLAIGVAMIVGHNVWSGGLLPVVVTLVGWLIFLKGLVLLMLPPDVLSRTLGQMQYGEHFNLYLAPSLAIGLYLTWAGFKTPMRGR